MEETKRLFKRSDVKKLIELAFTNDSWRIGESAHTKLRKDQRYIDDLDIKEVIIYGQREEEQDRWNDKWGHWTYALRNRNVDGSDIRIIFDIERYPVIVIVTVMHVYP